MTSQHPLQTRLWGEFRANTGLRVINAGGVILTIHPVLHTSYTIGYLPKGPNINKKMLDKLWEIGKKENCIFIQLEPNVEKGKTKYNFKNLKTSAHPLFTRYNFILDLTQSEDELLKNMQPKTRYNIRLAQKKGVKVTEDNSDDGFNEYLKLTEETTRRQRFYAHTPSYHRLMWETFKNTQNKGADNFSPHLFLATYQGKVLTAWLLFVLDDTLYYPYGASTSENREVMASNLMMWEVIRFGKKMGLKKFDMWGAANVADPKPDDIYFGFHRFKQGYGPRHVEYVGSYDLVINEKLYAVFKIADRIRWFLLRVK